MWLSSVHVAHVQMLDWTEGLLVGFVAAGGTMRGFLAGGFEIAAAAGITEGLAGGFDMSD